MFSCSKEHLAITRIHLGGLEILLLQMNSANSSVDENPRLPVVLHLLAQGLQELDGRVRVLVLAHHWQADLDQRQAVDTVLKVPDELLVHFDQEGSLLEFRSPHEHQTLERQLVPQSFRFRDPIEQLVGRGECSSKYGPHFH